MTFMLGGFASGLSSGIMNGMQMYQTYQKLSALSATSQNIDKAKAGDKIQNDMNNGTGVGARGSQAGAYEEMLGEPGPGQGTSTTGSGSGSTAVPDISGMPDPRKTTIPALGNSTSSPSTSGGAQRDNQNPSTYGSGWAPGQGVSTQGGPGQPAPILNDRTTPPVTTGYQPGGPPQQMTPQQQSDYSSNRPTGGGPPTMPGQSAPPQGVPQYLPAPTPSSGINPAWRNPGSPRPPTGPQIGGAATRPPQQGIYVPGAATPPPAPTPQQTQLRDGQSPSAPTLANPQNTLGQGILSALGGPSPSAPGSF